jgi:hypothetical protein
MPTSEPASLFFCCKVERLNALFYWVAMKQLIKQMVEECGVCKRMKLERMDF